MKHLAVAALVLATGCGPDAAIWLKVEAPLHVPDECDGLRVEARRGLSDGPVIFEQTYHQASDQQFPLTLSLGNTNPANLGEAGVTVSAAALKGGELARPWAQGSVWTTLQRDQFVQVLVLLRDRQDAGTDAGP